VITRSSINTKLIYFIMYTRFEQESKISNSTVEEKVDIVDSVIEYFSDNHKLIHYPFLGAWAAMRAENVEITYIPPKNNQELITTELIDNLDPMSIFKNYKVKK